MHFFITGTGTDVGKTFFSCLFLAFLKKRGYDPIYYKPIATGCHMEKGKKYIPDKEIVVDRTHAQTHVGCSYLPASAPFTIQEHFDSKANLLKLLLEKKERLIALQSPLISEGIGGVAVPLWTNYLLSDLIRDFQCPIFLLSLASLGTINHTLLSIEHLQKKQIPILGFILNQSDPKNNEDIEKNAETITQCSSIPHLFTIQYAQKSLTPKQENVLCSLISL